MRSMPDVSRRKIRGEQQPTPMKQPTKQALRHSPRRRAGGERRIAKNLFLSVRAIRSGECIATKRGLTLSALVEQLLTSPNGYAPN
jgi:hypothetical protein